MTEASYQQGRKFMQQVNHIRGLITKAEGDVAKWTKIEDSHRKNLRPEQADGAKKILNRSIKRLDDLRMKFELMEFPASNIVIVKTPKVQCLSCGGLIESGETFCGKCLS